MAANERLVSKIKLSTLIKIKPWDLFKGFG
jgi:hypothetical protein